MGLLDNLGDAAGNTVGGLLSTLTDPFKKAPVLLPPDFKEGFIIIELVNGKQRGEPFILLGDMLPMVPFEFGGEQKVIKEYYPGNPEPVVQVLGARETDTTIHGRLKAKHYKQDKFIQLPELLQREMDAIRLRGNLLKITLGEWIRYAFLQKSSFKMYQLSRIDYELTFTIVGFKEPKNCKNLDTIKEVPFNHNSDLIAAAQAFQSKYSTLPKGFPGGIGAFLSELISDVATVTNIATNFIDTAIKTGADLVNSANRALGLIKNARASISRFSRGVRSIKLGIADIGTTVTSLNGGIGTFTSAALLQQSHQNALQVISAYNNAHFVLGARSSVNNLLDLLSKLETQIKGFTATQPLARYSIQRGDTLQKIAFKFYNNSDNWKLIYDHNKLTSTDLSSLGVLEIPKL